MRTWVWVTLNGVSTLTSGAVVAVDPLTATLPVAPVSVHSGVAPLCGRAIGHGLGGAAVSVTEDDTLSTVPPAGVSVLELHAASIMTNEAPQATTATVEGVRDGFTVPYATADRCLVRKCRSDGGIADTVLHSVVQ